MSQDGEDEQQNIERTQKVLYLYIACDSLPLRSDPVWGYQVAQAGQNALVLSPSRSPKVISSSS